MHNNDYNPLIWKEKLKVQPFHNFFKAASAFMRPLKGDTFCVHRYMCTQYIHAYIPSTHIVHILAYIHTQCCENVLIRVESVPLQLQLLVILFSCILMKSSRQRNSLISLNPFIWSSGRNPTTLPPLTFCFWFACCIWYCWPFFSHSCRQQWMVECCLYGWEDFRYVVLLQLSLQAG